MKKRAFTLLELVVVIAVLAVSAGIVAGTFRHESPARVMENASVGLATFCARARFQALEHGEDILVYFSPEKGEFSTARTLSEEELAKEEQQRADRTDDQEPLPDPPRPISWRLPEKVTVSRESYDDADQDDSGRLELIRFFPDGGASGTRTFSIVAGKLSRTFDVSPLTGLVTEKENEEVQ